MKWQKSKCSYFVQGAVRRAPRLLAQGSKIELHHLSLSRMGMDPCRGSEQSLCDSGELYNAGESEALRLFGNLLYFFLSNAIFASLVVRRQTQRKVLHATQGIVFLEINVPWACCGALQIALALMP